jgi:hypothetical protein
MSREQKRALADAYVFDRVVERGGGHRALRHVQRRLHAIMDEVHDIVPAAKERILALLAEERDKAAAEVGRLKAALSEG